VYNIYPGWDPVNRPFNGVIQGANQLASLAITLGIALLSGYITGKIIKQI